MISPLFKRAHLSKRPLLLPCVLILSALALAACGGGSGEEGEIKEAIEAFATDGNPADCGKLVTPHFLEQDTQEEGFDALDTCKREAREGRAADSVSTSNIEIESLNPRATAAVAFTGGEFDGQEVEVALEKQNGQWKLNEITGFVKFDEAKAIEELETGLAEPSSEVSRGLAACITKSLEEAAQSKFEEVLLSPTTDEFEELTEDCSSAGG
jgi:hypothetical protein